jgi:hypothetical protein
LEGNCFVLPLRAGQYKSLTATQQQCRKQIGGLPGESLS